MNWISSMQSRAPAMVIAVVFIGICRRIGQLEGIGQSFHSFFFLYIALFLSGVLFFVFFPKNIPNPHALFGILFVALFCRLVLTPLPMSDDVARYSWEGKIMAQGFNPYVEAPDSEELVSFRDEDWKGINHKDQTACYPPLMTLFFSFLDGLPFGNESFRFAFMLFDLGTILVLFYLLVLFKKPVFYLIIYAMNPVILISFAAQGHLDSAMIFFLCCSFLAFEKKKWRLAFFLFSLAVQSKQMAILCLPFMINRENIRHLWWFVVFAWVPFTPFMLTDGFAPFRSLLHFGTAMAHNGFVHSLLRFLIPSLGVATVVSAILFLSSYARLFFVKRQALLYTSFWCFLLFYIFSPTVHFWYLSWLIPLLCFYPRWSVLLLVAFFGGSYVAYWNEIQTGIWAQSEWWHWMQWGPFGLVLGWELIRERRWRKNEAFDSHYMKTAIIIPTLNAEHTLEACLDSVMKLEPPADEILVVDGGSEDRTEFLVSNRGIQLIKSQGGRGCQIKHGCLAVQSDLLVILHADAQLEPDVLARIKQSLVADPRVVGGAIGQRFPAKGIKYRVIEFLNDVRAGLFGIAFGDQVQFFNRKRFPVSSVPDIPLMEDVELSFRLGFHGRRVFLWGGVSVSEKKWNKAYRKRFLQVVLLFSTYCWRRLFSMPGHECDTRDLYEKYYGTKVKGGT